MPPLPFTLVVLDTETTGFVPGSHRIIEFAMLKAEGGKVVDEYEQLLACGEPIPPHVEVLTRIRTADLGGKPSMADLRDSIRERIGTPDLLVGQNLAFDTQFLKRDEIDLGDIPWVDTSTLASIVFPEFRSYSLGYMSAVLGLRHEPKHRALGDVRATWEMLLRIWERLQELPPARRAVAQDIMLRGPEGYRRFFGALKNEGPQQDPAWFHGRQREGLARPEHPIAVPPPDAGTVALAEEGLHPATLSSVIAAARDDATAARHWIAVKNLTATLRRIRLGDDVAVVAHPLQLLDPEAASRLLATQQLTADEASLALKLAWYEPVRRDDISIHGGEKDVWNGKLACARSAPAYAAQFRADARVVLIDQRQLLGFLRDPAHAAHGLLQPGDHVVMEDASMLEDVATKAFGAVLSLDELRAASQGNAALVSLADVASLWAAKIAAGTDAHELTAPDYGRPETKGLLDRARESLAAADLEERHRELLGDLVSMLVPPAVKSITWLEHRADGSVILQRAPERVDELLRDHLYVKYRTTLLVPPGDDPPELLPKGTKTARAAIDLSTPTPTVRFATDTTLEQVLLGEHTGKTIVLAGSKRIIETLFIKYTETLEQRGVPLICQGWNGGQGRMEAEFQAVNGPAVWLLTPWTYEGIELPPIVDRLVIDTLPFDHPAQVVLGLRAKHYRSGFAQYFMPRLQGRLFRLLRAYCRHRVEPGDVLVLDKRIDTKDYGKDIRAYLERLAGLAPTPRTATAPKSSAPEPSAKKPSQQSSPGQASLF